MYRNYLLKAGFWSNKDILNKVFLKHDCTCGGIYAIILKKGVKIVANRTEYYFNNMKELDEFLDNIQNQKDFVRILRTKQISKALKMLNF